jgi:hypothetical protein
MMRSLAWVVLKGAGRIGRNAFTSGGVSVPSSAARSARRSFVSFRLAVATIAGFVGAGLRSSLAAGRATLGAASSPSSGEAASAAVSANLGRRLLFVVTTAGPVSGANR